MALLAANDTIAALEEHKEELLKENQLLKEEKEQLDGSSKTGGAASLQRFFRGVAIIVANIFLQQEF